MCCIFAKYEGHRDDQDPCGKDIIDLGKVTLGVISGGGSGVPASFRCATIPSRASRFATSIRRAPPTRRHQEVIASWASAQDRPAAATVHRRDQLMELMRRMLQAARRQAQVSAQGGRQDRTR
jgi:hypothetical protein